MTDLHYDLIVVGGGLAGSALARAMAEAGARVLVLEREREFRDRVRGEGMHAWGVAEARALGIDEALMKTCGHIAQYWARSHAGGPALRRDLIATSGHHAGEMTFYHPAMQNELIRLAGAAGAEIQREATVSEVITGSPPRVRFSSNGREMTLGARLVVGADGRRSQVRHWAGFPAVQAPDWLRVAGVLLGNLTIDDTAIHMFTPATFGALALLFPLRDGRVRAYFISGRRDEHDSLSGAAALPMFIRYCSEAGVPADWLVDAQMEGPLATFEGASTWVEHPHRGGVVLVGDAAGASDPSWGCGLSLTLRDVRSLRDELRATDDWAVAADRYAAARTEYFRALHTLETWMAEIFYGSGPEGDRVRAQALPQLMQGKGPDLVGAGPLYPTDDATRKQLLGY